MRNKLYLLLPVISGTCWGTQGVFVRILANAGFNNVTIITSRIIVSMMVVLAVILITDRSKLRVNVRDLPLLCSIGVFGVLLLAFAYNCGGAFVPGPYIRAHIQRHLFWRETDPAQSVLHACGSLWLHSFKRSAR